MTPQSTLRRVPAEPDDSPGTMELLCDVILTGEAFLPKRFEADFAKAGFARRRICQEEYHPTVWTAWLTATGADFPKDKKLLGRQIRRALAKNGIKIPPAELTVIEQRGCHVKCAFLFGTLPPPPDFRSERL